MMLVHLFHMFVISSLLGYVYWTKTNATWLGILGLLVALFHGYSFFKTRRGVFLFHVLLGSLLAYIGFLKPNKESFVYQLVLAVAFGAFGYHAFKLSKIDTLAPEKTE
jgi:hypothetical protein